jgi:hypothetical protein
VRRSRWAEGSAIAQALSVAQTIEDFVCDASFGG